MAIDTKHLRALTPSVQYDVLRQANLPAGEVEAIGKDLGWPPERIDRLVGELRGSHRASDDRRGVLPRASAPAGQVAAGLALGAKVPSAVPSIGVSETALRAAPRVRAAALATVDRYIQHYNADGDFIPSNIGGNGDPNALGVLSQARHLYGMVEAYELSGDPEYLQRAQRMASAYRARFIDRSTTPPSFHETLQWDPTSKSASPRDPQHLTVNYQAYGLAGLVALYGATGDQELLSEIRTMHRGFVERFRDRGPSGGFFEQVARNGDEHTGVKSFASTVYVATSYLADLAEVDAAPDAPDYRGQLRALANIVLEHFLDPKTGFIKEVFDENWNENWQASPWQHQKVGDRAFTISPVGHNTQVGWFLLRMFDATGDERYRAGAVEVLSSMLNKGFDWEHGGVYDSAKREEQDPAARWMWGTNKSWWQQAETIMALSLAERLDVLGDVRGAQGGGREALRQTVAFWDNYQIPGGGEHETVQADGTPIVGALGTFGKASYHSTQLATVLTDYARNPALGTIESLVQQTRAGASLDELRPTLNALRDEGAINSPDLLGLTATMNAAALGRADIVRWFANHGADLAARNPLSGATLLHYAAMARVGGAEVLEEVLTQRPELASLLNERIPSNGHTVAMEATFHRNSGFVAVLIERPELRADLTTTAVTGWGPRTFAEREAMPFADALPASAVPREGRDAWLAEQDRAWLAALPSNQRQAAQRGINFIAAVRAGSSEDVRRMVAEGVDVNGTYGRLGATALNAIFSPGMDAEALRKGLAVQKTLLDLGADPRVHETGLMQVNAGFRESVFGYNEPLRQLCEHVRTVCGEVALRNWIDSRGPNNGYSKLIDAASFGRLDPLLVLLDNHADPSVAGFNGVTAYSAALAWNESAPEERRFPDQVVRALLPRS